MTALDSAGSGAVVAGTPAAARDNGLVGTIRADPELSAAISTAALVVLVLAALLAIGSAIAVSAAGQVYFDLLLDQWNSFVFWLENLFS